MAGYNRTREVEQLLEKTESKPPSFTVHLHSEHWILNNGSKFLYTHQIASLLDDIRAHRIPVDFLELFDSARVPFYEGCMIVELLDYRPQKSQEPALKIPQKTRVVLHPNPETLWADLCSLNQRHGGKWSDKDALEVEAKLILATALPLCLDPDPHLSRIVNHVLRVSTPSMPLSLKRKAATMEPEEDGPEKAKRERLLTFMAPRDNRHTPSYRMLDAFLASKKAAAEAAPIEMPGNQYMNVHPQAPQISQSHSQPPAAPQTPVPPASQSHSPTDIADNKAQKMKINTPQMPNFSVAFARSNGSHTPVPPQPTHQFVNQHPPAVPTGSAIMQPQVYPSFQASTEAAKRTATPSQQQQMQFQQQYLQQYQTQQTQPQQQQHHQPQAQPQQRPPSQPQHPLAQQHAQQQTAAQIQQVQQRFTQSPKPPAQSNAASPVRTQPTPQPYPGATAQFQPPIPTPHFLQQPPQGIRVAPKTQPINGTQQQQQHQHQHQQVGPSQPTHPPNANPTPAQIQQFQFLYSQQLQQSQQQLQQQQRMTMAAANAQKNGGRTTPQVQMQQNQGQVQQQQPQSAAATPSPVRSSPMVTHQQLATAAAARFSPMPAKAQIPQQGQGQQQQQIPQQHPLASQGMMQPPRATFTPQYNPSQLRPLVHGTAQQGHMVNNGQGAANGTPTMATASPRMNGRPITPAIVGLDGKPQQQQGMMQTQQPIRRQTPLQQAQQQQALNAASPQTHLPNQAEIIAMAQAQARAQTQQQAAQQQQPQGQGQQAQTQTQTPVQQPAQIHPQQMAQYAQMYNYQPYQQMQGAYWRSLPGMPNPTPQQMQQFLQQQRLAQQQGISSGQSIMVNGQPQQQQQPQQVGVGMMNTPQMNAQQALIAAQQKAAMHQQQQQTGMSIGGGQPSQQAMMGKMTMPQTQAQMHAQAQSTGKGKAGPKKGATAKKGPQR